MVLVLKERSYLVGGFALGICALYVLVMRLTAPPASSEESRRLLGFLSDSPHLCARSGAGSPGAQAAAEVHEERIGLAQLPDHPVHGFVRFSGDEAHAHLVQILFSLKMLIRAILISSDIEVRRCFARRASARFCAGVR